MCSFFDGVTAKVLACFEFKAFLEMIHLVCDYFFMYILSNKFSRTDV